MTRRITRAHVEAKLDTINTMLGYAEPFTPGSIGLRGAYGGWGVVRYTEHRGTDDLTGLGTMRDCARYLDGMREALFITREASTRA